MSALRKVLVVDDDPVVGKSFDRVLSDKGYVVVTAEDGYDALVKLANENYDVVFTDIKMPGMNGLAVAERVKARKPWIPVVIVTGYGTKENEERAEAAGVVEFLHKPLSPEAIEASAAKAMKTAEPAAAPSADAAAAKAIVEAHAPAVEVEAAPAAAEEAAPGKLRMLKNMALFLMAPFVGLVYAVLLPFVGLGMLAWVAGKPLLTGPKAREALRFAGFVGKLLAAPFIGLAWFVLFPLVGIAMLAWTGGKALFGRVRAE
jgi:CheY-like chemotaxis protein